MKKVFFTNYGRKLPPFPTLFLEAYTKDIEKYLGFKFKTVLTRYLDGYGNWYFIKNELEKYGQKILRDLESGQIKISNLESRLRQFAEESLRKLRLFKKRLAQATKKRLLSFLKEYCYLHRQVVALGDSVPYVSEKPALAKLENLIFKIVKKRELAPQLTAKLIQFDKLSFAGREEFELLEIALKGDLKTLKNHAKKWTHLAFDYVGPVTSYQSFYQRYRSFQREDLKKKLNYYHNLEKIVKKEKQEIIKKYKLTPGVAGLAQLIQEASFLYDLKKSYLTKMTYKVSFVLDRVAKVCNLKRDWLHWITEEELYLILEGKLILTKEIIKQRKEDSLIVGREGRSWFAIGQEREKYLKQLEVPKTVFSRKEFKGQPASPGRVQGEVCRIMGPAHLNKMKKGAILVAPQTTVDYMSAIRLASAILTDIGGIISHAAIVSRELKIPCLVDTKVATKILKDGQLVEVDTNKGIVKIIRDK